MGIAFIVYDNNFVEIHNRKYRLNNESTVKMIVIHKAVNYLKSNLVNWNVRTISDSLSDLTFIV